MTGYGEARSKLDGRSAWVEVRTINGRYFKLTTKCLEAYNAFEPDIEQVVRRQIRRGSVQITLRVERPRSGDAGGINAPLLDSYRQQLLALFQQWRVDDPLPYGALLALPGVVADQPVSSSELSEDWPLIEATLEAALANLAGMRTKEGAAMAADLADNCRQIAAELTQVESRAPLVAESYRTRLNDRLQKTLEQYQVTLDPADLIKEVSIFAERSDISEETVRLRSHLEQFDLLLKADESSGRKLEFLTQEMFREANTIGSKANDVAISRHVIEIKAAIERIREMIQNVE
ncbi:MAG TPA: YicC/YloC family endoribonuclease [Xanthobacteraceae bacterium]|nr:YicC/YloC family endoribonuclease [Pirellulales bacterium]HVY58382.1 YicC/YloC family endoribonuclease [Xanthobacteraceae bacterium]